MTPFSPSAIADILAVSLMPASKHAMRWRGQSYSLRYGIVTLELIDDDGSILTWPGVVAFSAAPLKYPLLGMSGCLEYLNVTFRGAERVLEIASNPAFPTLFGS